MTHKRFGIELRLFLFGLALSWTILLGQSCMAAPAGEVLIVDTEFPGKPNSDPRRIERALHKAGASRTRILPWTALTQKSFNTEHPMAVVLSGQGTPWTEYDSTAMTGLCKKLRGIRVPMLGICGGHQLLAIAFGGRVSAIKRLRPGRGYSGCLRERGWKSVVVQSHDLLFSRLARRPAVWLNHCEEVKILPPGFDRTVSDGRGANQAMKSRTRPIYGVQFHPEVSNEQHGYGQRFLRQFLTLKPRG